MAMQRHFLINEREAVEGELNEPELGSRYLKTKVKLNPKHK